MEKVYFATGNQGKVDEMRPSFEKRGLELVQIDVDVPEIDDMDVEKVARRKVIDSYKEWGDDGLLIVEDTGFFVKALNGFPGAEAALFAGTVGASGLLKLMENMENREAYFRTSIAVYDDRNIETFTGKMKGKVPENKRGESKPSLPYNSYFIPEGEEESLAENQDLKNKKFHRRKAVNNFLDWLESR